MTIENESTEYLTVRRSVEWVCFRFAICSRAVSAREASLDPLDELDGKWVHSTV